MQPLSVIVPCRNEQEVIEGCLASVRFADEIMVVDSFSTDGTLAIARKYTDRILQHEYVNSAAQKNWAIPQARHEWVLIVDSDERVTPELASEIKTILAAPQCDGYWIRRRNFMLGKEIRHGTWSADKVLRLFRRDLGRYENKHVHAEIQLDGRVGWCRGKLEHHGFRSLSQYLSKLDRYSTWGALNARDRGLRGTGWRIAGHSLGGFAKSYLLRCGFLDATEGLIIAFMEAYSAFLKYTKLYELQHSPPPHKD
jgi:glycosyltransferase involved in cell wall biosynthesis